MEHLLDLYAHPYDPARPLLCLDERPCQLLGEVIGPWPLASGKPRRHDYHYTRHGVCTVFIAFEPATGFRMVQVRTQRTKADYTAFLQQIAAQYPQAAVIRVVQDNLNTHTPGAFYAAVPPADAWALAQRFEMHYTPPHASWLNMAELELAILATQCLDRRIPDQERLAQEAYAWAGRRNAQHATVHWQFTIAQARQTFQRFYPNLSESL